MFSTVKSQNRDELKAGLLAMPFATPEQWTWHVGRLNGVDFVRESETLWYMCIAYKGSKQWRPSPTMEIEQAIDTILDPKTPRKPEYMW